MTSPYAVIIADSINTKGDRVTTFEVKFHRFVLAEFNTHRVFSRNSASSRAIPFEKQVSKIEGSGLAFPLAWPQEQKGMQGGELVSTEIANKADYIWRKASEASIACARTLRELPGGDDEFDKVIIHKSVVNRLLEPFMWHTAVVTATAWGNFFDQRCSPLAQPEIRAAAELMQQAYVQSEPKLLKPGEWHLPYIQEEDWEAMSNQVGLGVSMYPQMVKVSAARCARVSYLTQDGSRDLTEDLNLYERLVSTKPQHWSPLEHVAMPWLGNRQEGVFMVPSIDDKTYHNVDLTHRPKTGNLLGWASLRTIVEAELHEETYR
jgi:thymidylate synthase ThyX